MTNIEALNPAMETWKPSNELLRGLYRRSGESFTLCILRDEGWSDAILKELMDTAKSDGPAIDL